MGLMGIYKQLRQMPCFGGCSNSELREAAIQTFKQQRGGIRIGGEINGKALSVDSSLFKEALQTK
ncbi:MAG: hypothetical protein ACLQF0_06660 [Dissulfurispiraceae bacterium]